jgi:imidazolonepropionase-like amidohydrolase
MALGEQMKTTRVLTFLLILMAPCIHAQPIVLDNARLVIGDGRVVEQGSILIEDGMIRAVGTGDELRRPGSNVIDLAGKTVMPALIDGHAHLGYQGPETWGGESYGRENLIENLQRYAYYGFGAVFSAGSDPANLMLELQSQLANGELIGARPLFAAGMAPPGNGPNDRFLPHALEVERKTGMTVLHGLEDPEQARREVRAVAANGVSFIKLWVDDRGGSQQKLSPDIYRAVADEAIRHGLKVFVHQQSPADMPPLLEAGVHGFLHGRLGPAFDRDLARRTAQAGAFVVPNLGLGELRREAIGDDPFLMETHTTSAARPMTAAASERTRHPTHDPATEAALRDSLDQLLAERVDVMLGTDAGAVPYHPYGYSGHRELEIYVRLGMTPMQALQAGTSVAARHLGLTDMGLLAPGYSADLVVLAANPLADIRNTRAIDSVYLRGRPVDRHALGAAWRGTTVNE